MTPRVLDPETQSERENAVLDAALNYIERESIATLTVDKLVKELPFSKGTVYNHFSGKEDILLALCNRSMGILIRFFHKASQFKGSHRERGLAIHFSYMLYAKIYPTYFMLVLSAKTANITEKASPRQREEHLALEGKIMTPIIAVFQEAIDEGVLNPRADLNFEQLTFLCWSVAFGTNVLLHESIDRCVTRSELHVERELLNNVNVMFDGLRFTPMTDEFDWTETIRRLKDDTFAEEVALLESHGLFLVI